MPYKIVKTFEKGNSKLSVVPSDWERDGVLYWPRYNENKLKRIEHSCPEHNWRKMNCKVKRSNLITFHKAEQELDKMCKKSETETDTEEHLNSGINPNNMDFHKIVTECYDDIFPEALARTIDIEAPERQEVSDEATHVENSVILIAPPVMNSDTSAQQNVTTEVQIDNSALTFMILSKIETLEENYKTLNNKITELIKAQQEDRKFVSESVQSILLGLSNVSVQFEHGINLLSRAENNRQKTNIKIQSISSENELNDFENLLETPEVEEEWKRKFSVICGKGKGRGVNNAYALVDSLFSRGFLNQCSWAGGSRTSDQKICFKSHSKIINFFFNIINESDSSFTLLDCHKFFKNVLKNSRQRNESKQERTSRTKNRPKIKATRKNVSNEKQPSLPIAATSASENRSVELPFSPIAGTSPSENRSGVSLPVAVPSDSEDINPISSESDDIGSASFKRITTEPLETSV